MTDRESDFQQKTLQEEYIAARAELESAETAITLLSDTGFPIEHMDVEFHKESRARAALAGIHQRLAQVAADDADPDFVTITR